VEWERRRWRYYQIVDSGGNPGGAYEWRRVRGAAGGGQEASTATWSGRARVRGTGDGLDWIEEATRSEEATGGFGRRRLVSPAARVDGWRLEWRGGGSIVARHGRGTGWVARRRRNGGWSGLGRMGGHHRGERGRRTSESRGRRVGGGIGSDVWEATSRSEREGAAFRETVGSGVGPEQRSRWGRWAATRTATASASTTGVMARAGARVEGRAGAIATTTAPTAAAVGAVEGSERAAVNGDSRQRQQGGPRLTGDGTRQLGAANYFSDSRDGSGESGWLALIVGGGE
jgi:hypothetical protein